MKYLVTGGCGFIGSHIAEALVEKGHAVRIYDNLSSGHEENIARVRAQVEFIRADVRDFSALREAAAGMDGIFHEAALVSVFDSVERPRDNNEINIAGTLNVLLAAREQKVKRVVFASSAAIYGNDPALPKKEKMPPSPESPYALAKLTGEHYLSVFHKLYGLKTTALRYFNVFGPRQDPSSMYSGVISKFADDIRTGATPTIFGNGRQTRDFIYVKDVVRANLIAMSSRKTGRGEVLNIATGRRTSLLDLLKAFGDIYGRKIRPAFKPVRPGDVRHSVADIARARRVLGFKPGHTLRQGLQALVEHTGG
jgi:UDP-glucose 4-epimerase